MVARCAALAGANLCRAEACTCARRIADVHVALIDAAMVLLWFSGASLVAGRGLLLSRIRLFDSADDVVGLWAATVGGGFLPESRYRVDVPTPSRHIFSAYQARIAAHTLILVLRIFLPCSSTYLDTCRVDILF